jgi:hypothetical protein
VKIGAKRKLNTGEIKIGVKYGAKWKLYADPKIIGV